MIKNKTAIITFVLFGFIFWHLASQMLQVKKDGWYVGQVNLYGDLVFHLSLINKFLESEKNLPDSPIFAGEKINYPIFTDLFTAQIAKLSSVDFALFITTLIGGILTIFVSRLFILRITKNEKIVLLTLLLFLINGGLGFYYFFQDYFASANYSFLNFLTNLPREYTDIKEQGYWWINTYLAYFLPQRGFLFAFPITLSVLMLLHSGQLKQKRNYFILAGILAGLLSIVQAHSLFLIFLISIFFLPLSVIHFKNKKITLVNWLLFAALTAAISIPIIKLISSTQNPLTFIKFDPGWTSEENILWFWLKNLGLFAPFLIIASMKLFVENRRLLILYLPFFIIFILCNLFIFQPWDFDNSKLMIYWFFASAIIVAQFTFYQFFKGNLAEKILGVIFIFIMIFSGILDLFRTFTPPTNYRIFSNQDLEIAASIKYLTPKDSVFVTASDHNHPIPSLTGRSTLLGFHGWAWTHGIDYQRRASDIGKIYAGGNEAEALINFYHVNFVTIGPLENKSFIINHKYFEKYPQITLNKDWRLYDVSSLWSNSNR